MRTSSHTFVAVACLLWAAAAGASSTLETIDFSDPQGVGAGMRGAPAVAGTRVFELFGDLGTGPVKVWGFNERFGDAENAAVLFDTAKPTGEDEDLGAPNRDFADEFDLAPGVGSGGRRGSDFQNATPLGKVLILAEDLIDSDDDGLIDDPDDEGEFEDLRFEFDFSHPDVGPVSLYRMILIDVEGGEAPAELFLYGKESEELFSLILPSTGDNGVVEIKLGSVNEQGAFSPTENVYKMVVKLHGSGAISSLTFNKPEAPGPEIDIEKLTNGKDADDPTSDDIPRIWVGDPVTWTYRVRNIGSEQLQNVTVTDDRGVQISCPETTLEVGDSMDCTASGIAADLYGGDAYTEAPMGSCPGYKERRRLYANVGFAEGVGTLSEASASDSDASHYCSREKGPCITVRKQEKGPDTRGFPRGSEVTFEIQVKNCGPVELTEVTVSDELAPDCDRELGSLAAWQSETYTCSAPGSAASADAEGGCGFENKVIATGNGKGQSVRDSDTSTVELVDLAIDKSFARAEGGSAYFEIKVTNNGCDLDSVEVTDEVAPDCARALGALRAGETTGYTCSMKLENEACAEGARGGETVSACDTATFGGGPGPGPGPDPDPEPEPEPDPEPEPEPDPNGDRKASNWLLFLALLLLIGGGLFAWNRMKAG